MDLTGNLSNLVWNAIVALAASALAIFIPLDIIYNLRPEFNYLYFSLIITIIFLLDIVYKFFYHHRHLDPEFDVPLSINNYLQRFFIFDLIAVLPFGLLFDNPYVQLFSMMKLINVAVEMRHIRRREIRHVNTFSIIFFIYWIVHIAHWIACGWLAIRGFDNNAPILDSYLKSIYWAVTTITTIGYGDITPVTNSQIVFTMFVEIIGVGTYGYLIGKMASFFTKKDPAKSRYLANLEELSTLVKLRPIPKDLQRRIRNYHTYMYNQRLGYDEMSFLEKLPESLKVELSMCLKKDLINNITLFKGLEESFLRDMALHLSPVVLTPGDYVFREGDEALNMYFVVHGELLVLKGEEERIISTLEQGDFFGEIALFKDLPRTASVRAVSYCDLYKLSRDRFDLVLMNHPGVSEEVTKIAEDRFSKE
jgi:voltage-gated potassium channel